MQNMILNFAAKTTDFSEMLGQIVESNPEFIKSRKAFEETIERFSDDFTLYDSIDVSARDMVADATRISFEAGFNEGIRFIIGALSGREANDGEK